MEVKSGDKLNDKSNDQASSAEDSTLEESDESKHGLEWVRPKITK